MLQLKDKCVYDVKTIVQNITQGSRTDLERLRAIWVWLCHNIGRLTEFDELCQTLLRSQHWAQPLIGDKDECDLHRVRCERLSWTLGQVKFTWGSDCCRPRCVLRILQPLHGDVQVNSRGGEVSVNQSTDDPSLFHHVFGCWLRIPQVSNKPSTNTLMIYTWMSEVLPKHKDSGFRNL